MIWVFLTYVIAEKCNFEDFFELFSFLLTWAETAKGTAKGTPPKLNQLQASSNLGPARQSHSQKIYFWGVSKFMLKLTKIWGQK